MKISVFPKLKSLYSRYSSEAGQVSHLITVIYLVPLAIWSCAGANFAGGLNTPKKTNSDAAAVEAAKDNPAQTNDTTKPSTDDANTGGALGGSQDKSCAVGCCPSQKIALVDCVGNGAPNIKPGNFSITPVSCSAASGPGGALNGYDTIVYYGTPSGAGKLPAGIDAALNGGAKVLASIPAGSGLLSSFYSLILEIAIEYLSNIGGSTIQVHNANPMTAAFNKQEYSAARINYFMRSGLNTEPRWCSDLIASSALGFQTTTIHAYLLDNSSRKGLLVFNAMSEPNSQQGFDFTKPFMAAQLNQQWNRAGNSAACGLPCGSGNGGPNISTTGSGSPGSPGTGGGNPPSSSPPGNGFTTATGVGKPVIYLYPTKEQDITVKLDFTGELVTTYPKFDPAIGGWKVHANAQGQLTDLKDHHQYSYIYWNGKTEAFKPSFDDGFVVKGADARTFLQEKLAYLGLNARESNDMIVYWLPYLEKNAYNLVHFAHEEYTSIAKMTITPKPDSLLRVFMVFKGLKAPTAVKPQSLQKFDRKGFSAVEWGGTEIDGAWHIIQ
ncbi:MAG: hypothetical protein NTZ90_05745 [Proteobacteria bacterium]|nr:hypothetical protein [Pseudomonadota bacterium]